MKKLLKSEADTFLKYENVEPQPISQMTPNKFLSICRIIYDSWRNHYLDDEWYQYDDRDSSEEIYCHFKMMSLEETAWYGHEDMADSYIVKPKYYWGGYHFEELMYGGLTQDLTSIDMSDGSCIMTLNSRANLNQVDADNEELVNAILAYNACVRNGYYVDLIEKKRIVSIVRKLYETL